MIRVEHLSKKFKDNIVLDDIDLTIHDGEVVAIIGPSGTGKSTFLRCLDRLEKPESGTIAIDGETLDLAKAHGKELTELRKKTSMVFQNFNLFARKTALENVMEGLTVVKKISKEEAIQTAIAAAAAEYQRRPLEARGMAASDEWLQTLADDPGEFLRLRIQAEYDRRAQLGLIRPEAQDPW